MFCCLALSTCNFLYCVLPVNLVISLGFVIGYHIKCTIGFLCYCFQFEPHKNPQATYSHSHLARYIVYKNKRRMIRINSLLLLLTFVCPVRHPCIRKRLLVLPCDPSRSQTCFAPFYLYYFLIKKIVNYCPRVQENVFLRV